LMTSDEIGDESASKTQPETGARKGKRALV